MVLCEVALGNPEIVYGCCDKELGSKYDSRWAKGNSTTDTENHRKLPKSETVIPCGKIVENPEAKHSTFLYNEYVIYRPEQYRFRYLLYLKDHP